MFFAFHSRRLLTALCAAAAVGGWLADAAAQTRPIPADATTALARSRAPDSLLGRLLEPANNQAWVCGAAQGWDRACLRSHYRGLPTDWPRPVIDAGKDWQELSPVPPAPAPRQAAAAAQLALGTALFFDPTLSRKGAVACASCHQAGQSFTDGLPLSVGEDRMMGRRRAQPLYAAPFAAQLFWDGRAPSLEAQAKASITNVFEMNHSLEAALERVNAQPHYQQLARQALGQPRLSEDDLAAALATFVRSIRPPATLADEAIAGQTERLNDQQLLGLHLFRTKARCMNCHSGALLTDHGFHDLGLSFYSRRNQDLGRFEATRDKRDLGRFRTPSLRGVTQAGPWMHNGLFADLPGLLRLYNAGMGVVAGDPQADAYLPPKSPHIQTLQLNAEEIDALAEWLKVL